MPLFPLFPQRSSTRSRLRPAANRRLGCWETLGHGVTGLEQLESRALLAADLGVQILDSHVHYVPGTQTTTSVVVTNFGDATATNAAVSTALASAITQSTWSAAYSGGGSGPTSGAGNLKSQVTLPAGASATFTIRSTIGSAATGPLVSAASVSLAGDSNTANDSATNTLGFVPRSIVVSDDAGWTSSSLVRLVDPGTGATVASAYAFEPDYRLGVRAAVGDLDGDGKVEVVCVPGRGRIGELAVFRQNVAANGSVTLVRDSRYSLQPFGPGYRDGLNVAVADFTGDGLFDVAVSKSSGRGDVRIYESTPSSASGPLTLRGSLTPFSSGFGGASIAAADFGTVVAGSVTDAVRRDGKAELVVGSGPGTVPVVRVYDASMAKPGLVDAFQPLAPRFRGGLTVSVATLNADSIPDVLVAAGSGGGSAVEIYDGTLGDDANRRLAAFAAFAGSANANAAVFATGVDIDGDSRADTVDVVQGVPGGAAMARYDIRPAAAGSITVARKDTLPAVAGAVGIAGPATGPDANLIRTTSGLEQRELVVGTGVKPSSKTATVTVNYVGQLTDGTVFDSNTSTDGASFRLDRVIAGWTEGLQRMRVGGRSQFVIPADLAYGDSPPKDSIIPKNAVLVFDVTLLSTT
ncbi:MAG: hypothetical protein EBZ59_06025 [Planctomycetia bacterium]|nr:hypothetical protein [Planctomycetia bacterium]